MEGAALADARITAGPLETQSDERGRFRIGPLCRGTYIVQVVLPGFRPFTDTVLLAGDYHLQVPMVPAVQELEEVEVFGARPAATPVQASSHLYGHELREARGESLGETLRRMAGISVLQTGPSIAKPLIHGLTGNRILILNNGVRLEGQQWGSEHAPEIDPFIAEELIVIKGADCVRYGSDAIGGVVLVNPRPLPDSVALSGEFNWVGMSNNREGVISAIAEQRLKALPLAWRLQGTLRRAACTRTPDYYLQNTAYREDNFSAAWGWKRYHFGIEGYFSHFSADLGIFSGAHLHNLTDLNHALSLQRPTDTLNTGYHINRPSQQVRHDLAKVQAYLRQSEGTKWTLTTAGQLNRRSEYDKHGPLNDSLAALNRPELQFDLSTFTTELLWQHDYSQSWLATAGINGATQYNTYSGRYFIPYYRNYSAALFYIQRYRRTMTEWEAGVRYDYRWMQVKKYEDGQLLRPQYVYERLNMHAGMLWRLSLHADLHVHVGTAWRPPAVNELYSEGLHHGVAALEYGNPNLLPEQAFSTSLSLDVHDHDVLAGELTLYHTRIIRFIYLKPQPPPQLTIQGAFPVFVYDQTDARFSGLDAAVTVRLSRAWSVAPRLSLLYAYDAGNQDDLPLMPPHNGSVMVRWQRPAAGPFLDPFVSLTVEHVLQQRRAPGDDFAPPPPAFTLWSASLGATVRLGGQPLDVQLSGTNLTDLAYRNYMNRFRYYADEMGRNIVLRLTVPFSINPSH